MKKLDISFMLVEQFGVLVHVPFTSDPGSISDINVHENSSSFTLSKSRIVPANPVSFRNKTGQMKGSQPTSDMNVCENSSLSFTLCCQKAGFFQIFFCNKTGQMKKSFHWTTRETSSVVTDRGIHLLIY